MNRQNTILALAVGLMCGGMAFFLLYRKAIELERKTTPTQVLVATRYIPARSALRDSLVEKKTFPETFVSPSAIQSMKDVEGMVTLAPISAGEQILANKFGKPGESMSWLLEPGFRAFTLDVTDTSGVGGLLRPGDRVDVLAKTQANGREITAFLYQNLRVLAVGRNTGITPSGGMDQDTSGGYGHVTLSVSPEQAESLHFLEGRSTLRLVLRADGDEETTSLPVASEAEVLSRIGQPTRTKSRPIEVIRGIETLPKGEKE